MKIPVARPDLGELERKYLLDAFDSSWISSSGKYLNLVESLLPDFTGKPLNALTCNGTVAIHLALKALEIGPGDEVITPSFTFVATVNSILYCGAKPVFADISLNNLCLDMDSIIKKVNKKTKAIIFVHIYGMPNDLSKLKKFCREKKIYLIEDNAEGLGAKIGNRLNGSYGDISTYSFYGNKILTSGEGGCVSTSNKKIYNKIIQLKNQGMDPNLKYFFPIVGFNYRMTNISASILYGQIKRWPLLINQRLKLYTRYIKLFENYHQFKLLEHPRNSILSPWSFPIICPSDKTRDYLMTELKKVDIETRPFFIPIHLMPPYKKYAKQKENLINTSKIYRKGLNLPTSSNFSESELYYLFDKIQKILNKVKL
jgi:perosamine synthetase